MPLKRWYLSAKGHGVTRQTTVLYKYWQQDIMLHGGETHVRQVFSEEETISLILLHSQYNCNYETTRHEMGGTYGMYWEKIFIEGFG